MSENYHENYFMSEKWGLLQFFPSKTEKLKDTCQKCLLRNTKECLFAHCTSDGRADGRQGYFSRHEMPKERETKMKKGKDLITYKGHQITRKYYPVNAFIHYEYTVTGPLFEDIFKTYNLKEAKNEISDRIKL